MLYLEDYIELIEQLPQDLRDRFTEMRELDLKVQNTIDSLDTRVRRFFNDGRRTKPESLDEDYKSIHSSYKAALDDAEEKVSMASQIYDLVDRHLRKLDQELSRFKMELEADCSGITEILEKRSMAHSQDTTPYNATFHHSDSKRRSSDQERYRGSNLTNGLTDKTTYSSSYSNPLGASYPLVKEPKPFTLTPQKSSNTTTHNGSEASAPKTGQTNHPKSTKDIKEEGRGAQASLKAMTAAQKKAEQLGNSLSLSGLLGPSAQKQSSISTSSSMSTSSTYVDVTSNSHISSSTNTLLAQKQASLQQRAQKSSRRNQKTGPSSASSNTANASSSNSSDKPFSAPALDWVPDPNEPTYCLCNQVSYGEMVGCDNASCPIEWFHYGCVGLSDAPKGKWYCPDCAAQLKKRRIR